VILRVSRKAPGKNRDVPPDLTIGNDELRRKASRKGQPPGRDRSPHHAGPQGYSTPAQLVAACRRHCARHRPLKSQRVYAEPGPGASALAETALSLLAEWDARRPAEPVNIATRAPAEPSAAPGAIQVTRPHQ
jgi:hypothetical protein